MPEQEKQRENAVEEQDETPAPRFPELEELQQEVERRIRDNQRFLDNFLNDDYMDEDEEPDDEETFEEL
ncbi:MAG TPA: hypothetical protein VJ955_08130 [Desulfuromonadales bacterium]|nr:hypothetical protein [Desulfuromonadales bacterium]